MFGFLFRRKSSDKNSSKSGSCVKKNSATDNVPLPTSPSTSSQSISIDSLTPSSSSSASSFATLPTTTKSGDSSSKYDDDLKWYSVSNSNGDDQSHSQQCLPSTTAQETIGRHFFKLDQDLEFIDDENQVDEVYSCDNEAYTTRDRTFHSLDVGLESHIITERDMTETEKKAMIQLDEFKCKLLSKETEISLLQGDINILSADRDNKIIELEGLTSQIKKLREENELSLLAAKRIEKHLEDFHLRNNQLTQELLEKTESLKVLQKESISDEKRILEAQNRVKEVEVQLKELRKEKVELISEHEAIEVEREEEMRALQNTLDTALEQKIKIQKKFEYDFKAFRDSCSSQEQQLMDDFEWKLRQIESTCKARLLEKDLQIEEKLKDVRNIVEREITTEREELIQGRRTVDEQMRQVCHYKAYEAELIQLRGLTHEQQRALRSAARQLEHFKFNEKLLHDELRAARTLLDKEKSHLQVFQSTNQRRMEAQEENLHSKLDKQKNELNSKWEDRMRGECTRLKQDLSKLHAEEKHLAVESMKLQKDQELCSSKQMWEKQRQELQEIVSQLKDALTEKEALTHREVERITALADKDNWEQRKKIEKLTMSHEEEIEKVKAAHAKEMNSLEMRYEKILKGLHEVEPKLREYEVNEKKCSDLVMKKFCPMQVSSPLMQSDSGCGDEESSEESDQADSDVEGIHEGEESRAIDKCGGDEMLMSCASGGAGSIIVGKLVGSGNEASVHHLREEVASLQGSIEKLTSELVVEPSDEEETSSDETDSE